jgi:hypothetical protein
VFLHKSDLIPEQNLNSISENLQKYLTSEINSQIQYYNTSVFSESAYEAVGAVLSQLLKLKEEFSSILDEFVHKHLKSVIQIHLLTQEGAFLLQTLSEEEESLIPLNKIRKFFNLAVKRNTLANKDNSMISVEGKNFVYLVNFLERGLAFLSVISKELHLENSELSPEIYKNVLKLADELNFKSRSMIKEGNQN